MILPLELFDRRKRQVIRAALLEIVDRKVNCDTITLLRCAGLLASRPCSPTSGAPYTSVTTKHVLSAFGMAPLRDIEAFDDAGLLSRHTAQHVVAKPESKTVKGD